MVEESVDWGDSCVCVITLIVNARSLRLEREKTLNVGMIAHVLMYLGEDCCMDGGEKIQY